MNNEIFQFNIEDFINNRSLNHANLAKFANQGDSSNIINELGNDVDAKQIANAANSRVTEKVGVFNNQPISKVSEKISEENRPKALSLLGISKISEISRFSKSKNIDSHKQELEDLINITGNAIGASSSEISEMLSETLEHHSIETALTTFRNLAQQLKVKLPKLVNSNFKAKPLVQCGDCQNFKRDSINPDAGIGECIANAWKHNQKPQYSFTLRDCDFFYQPFSTTNQIGEPC